jgi:hypothetical protein
MSPVAKNGNVTTSLSRTGTAVHSLLSIFTIFGPTKLISSSKCAGAIHSFCTVHKLLVTSNLLTNGYHNTQTSFCTRRDVGANMKATLATCKDFFPPRTANNGGSQPTAHSPECMPSCPNLNLGVSRTPQNYVMLLCSSRMLKSVCSLRNYITS